jgi:putative ABC transport system substrate-binding protein
MATDIGRREIIAALSSVVAWPFAAHAQKKQMPVIGLVGGSTAASQAEWTTAFIQELRSLGRIDGNNVTIEYRWLEGNSDQAPAIFSELVRRKVDVIVTHGTLNVLAAKQVTSVIPIVFPSLGDPVGNRIVASLAKPEGNVTGLSVMSSVLAAKLVQLLHDVLPNIRHLTILSQVGNPVTALQTDEVKVASSKFGFEVALAEIRRAEDILPAIEALKGRTDALVVPSTPLYNSARLQINSAALKAGLPAIYFDREYVESGGLMSYGPNWPDLWRRAAHYVDRILRGENPATMPVEQPMTFLFVVNRKTAEALGIKLSRLVLVRADELIE